MSTNKPNAGATAAYAIDPTSRAARATSVARAFREDDTLRNLEACRVLVTGIFKDITPTGASVPWIEPLLFTAVVKQKHTGVPTNEHGVVLPEGASSAGKPGREYDVQPGRVAQILAPGGGVIIDVPELVGIGTDWGDFGLVDAINIECFPDELIPETGPNWLDTYEPKHKNLYKRIEARLAEVADRYRADRSREASCVRGAANAGILAVKAAQNALLSVFHEMARQSKPGKPAELGPVQVMWCEQLGMAIPEWAVVWDPTRSDTDKQPTRAEAALDRLTELMAAQAEREAAQPQQAAPAPDAVLARLEAIEKENRELRELLKKKG